MTQRRFFARSSSLWPWLALAVVMGCDAALLNVPGAGAPCVDDDECRAQSSRFVCVIGVCVDPDNTALDEVYLEVRPLETSGYQPQQLDQVQASEDGGRTTIELRQTVNVHGSVVDGALDSGVAAQVTAVLQQGIPGRALVVTADTAAADGTFALPLVESDTYSLSFWPSDSSRPPLFRERSYVVAASATGDTTLDDGAPVALPGVGDLVHLMGRVTAGEGTAQLGVEGLEVRVLDGKRRVSSVAKTDVGGHFALSVLPSAVEVPLVLEVRPTQQNRLNPIVRVELPALEDQLELDDVKLGVLQAPVPFSGVVSGPDGRPVPGASVYVRGALGAGSFSDLITADDEGRYDAELRPARYDFVVVAPPSYPSAGLLAAFSAEVGGEAPAPILNLPERLLVSGSVVDAGSEEDGYRGQPVGNASVQMTRISGVGGEQEPLLEGLGWTFTAVTDAEGKWQQRVDPGRYRVVIQPDASTTRPRFTDVIDVAPEETAHRFQLAPSSVVAGYVSGVEGQPIAMSTVTAYAPLVGETGAAIELGSAQTKADGSFEILLPVLGR